MDVNKELIYQIVVNQAKNIWSYSFDIDIKKYIDIALNRCEENFAQHRDSRMREGFNPHHTVQYSIFLYNLSRCLFLDGFKDAADIIYYLNKNLNNVEWFYEVDLPIYFGAQHPLGSVLGKAKYGEYLFVYQCSIIGGNWTKGKLYYPVLGNNVLMYANSSIIGDCRIGDNVIVAANTHIINQTIPSNCIVFGGDKGVQIVQKTPEEIAKKTDLYWDIHE